MLRNDPLGLPLFRFDADPDSDLQFDADPDSALQFDADPDSALQFDADQDPASQNGRYLLIHADPDPQHCFLLILRSKQSANRQGDL